MAKKVTGELTSGRPVTGSIRRSVSGGGEKVVGWMEVGKKLVETSMNCKVGFPCLPFMKGLCAMSSIQINYAQVGDFISRQSQKIIHSIARYIGT